MISRWTSGMTSWMTPLMSSSVFSSWVFLPSARTRWTIWLARLPSAMMLVTAVAASPSPAAPRPSQRRQASPLVTMAASG